MGPKAAPKKGGEDVDLSDLASLPPVTTCLFQVACSRFKSAEARAKIQEHVSQNLPEGRVKTLTRQDIVEYGKGKGIIDEGASSDAAGKAALTYAQMLAQSAADRLFELKAAARKAKKEKLSKLEEEAAAKAAEAGVPAPEKVETDDDLVDVLFNLPDFPTTAAEALAFSQYGQAINCFFEIYQVQETVDGAAPADLKAAKEVPTSAEEAEAQHVEEFIEQVASLKTAIAQSAKNAPIRNCAIFRVPFCDVELVEFKQNEEGEQTTNTLTAEQSFMKSLLADYIEKYASYSVNYQRFKEGVELQQLMPDKAVMQELKDLKRARQQYEIQRAEREASKKELAEQQLSDAQKEQLSPEEVENIELQKNESLKAIDTELEAQKEIDIKNQERVKELQQMAKRSIDEERDKKKHFSDKVYKNDFIPDKESANCVPSIMSAMISQIALENEQAAASEADGSTEPETLDDLFEAYKDEIAFDTNLMEREPAEEELAQPPAKGILPTDFNVYETYDTSSRPIQTLPAGILEDCKDHAVKIADREKEAARNLVLPGCGRHMMPEVPTKSQRLRDFENPQFYPFSTLPIEDAERTMQLRAFQQLIKGGIDEGAKPKERLAKNKIFERKYDEYLEPDIFRQVLQDALRQDPDLAAAYYPRTDQLLLVLHNKINNSKRSSENKEKPHGLKKWRAAFRVMPDFQGWIEFFGQSAMVQQPDYQPKDASEPAVKYLLDPELVPTQMLDVDDHRVQNVSQTLNQFFPDDNSILTSEEWEIGGVKRTKSIVYKDGFTFGLRTVPEGGHLPVEKLHGLVSYKPVGEHQFWLNFQDKESKLLVETVEAARNERELIEVKPPEPTAEEIAAKEEAAKQAAAAQAKQPKKGGAQPTAAEVPEEKEPEPTYAEAPPTFLDTLFQDEELGAATRGPCVNLTLKNGLIVRHMPNGDVVQVRDQALEGLAGGEQTTAERDRVHLRGGIVVRHFHNDDCEVLYPNGEHAYFNRTERKWTVTNDKGFRREYKDGKSKDLPKINCLNQTDAKTGVVTKVRADKVVLIRYEDGNLYCQHADGTQIFSQDDGQQTRVEKDGFAPVMYQGTDPGEDEEDWMDTSELKSRDGMMTLVFLPDGGVVKSIKFFKSEAEKDREVLKHIYQRADYSCFMIDSDGDFRIISTNTRAAINDEDERARLGTDSDYLKQMYQPNGVHTPGVFQGHISDRPEEVHLATRDSERPFFYRINGQSKLEKRAYAAFEENDDWRPVDQSKAYDGDQDIEPVGTHRNPFSRSFLYPRMFIINPNGEGLELLTQDQIDQVVKHSQYRGDTLTTSRVEYIDNTQMNSIQVISKVTSIQEVRLANDKMGALSFPEYAWPYIIPRKTEEEMRLLKPLQDQYQFRNITEYSAFEPLKQSAFLEDYNRFTEWKMSQVRYDSEFGITHVAPKDGSLDLDEIEDAEFYAKRINLKIYNERALLKEAFKRSVFKDNFEKAYNQDEDIVGFRKRMTTVEREEQEIKAELEKRQKAGLQKQIENEKAQKEEALQYWREKKKAKTRAKVEERLKEYKDKKETPTFASQYHKSRAGIEYFKANPVKPPSEEVLMRMSQRINRSQQNTEKGQSMFDGNSQKSARSGAQEKGQTNEDKDNPIVALEPEDHLKQASVDKSKKFTSASKHTGEDMEGEQASGDLGMSLYMQEKIYLKQLDQERVLKAEEHHVIKTKDFDVYGQLRQERPQVQSTVKSEVPSELNEKFITTECITDRRVKISSMANRQYINAPSIEEVRKQGQHQMILQAINKKQTFSELINQANSMVTSVLHDSLKRSVNILPSACRFGPILHGQEVEMTVIIQNEDSLSQRIHIKPVADKRIAVRQESYGAIAPGMTRKLIVSIKATAPDALGKLKDEVHILTKSDIFKLPVEAEVLNAEDYEKRKQELAAGGTGAPPSRVRTRLRSSIAQGRQQNAIVEEKPEATEQKGSDEVDEKKESQEHKESASNVE